MRLPNDFQKINLTAYISNEYNAHLEYKLGKGCRIKSAVDTLGNVMGVARIHKIVDFDLTSGEDIRQEKLREMVGRSRQVRKRFDEALELNRQIIANNKEIERKNKEAKKSKSLKESDQIKKEKFEMEKIYQKNGEEKKADIDKIKKRDEPKNKKEKIETKNNKIMNESIKSEKLNQIKNKLENKKKMNNESGFDFDRPVEARSVSINLSDPKEIPKSSIYNSGVGVNMGYIKKANHLLHGFDGNMQKEGLLGQVFGFSKIEKPKKIEKQEKKRKIKKRRISKKQESQTNQKKKFIKSKKKDPTYKQNSLLQKAKQIKKEIIKPGQKIKLKKQVVKTQTKKATNQKKNIKKELISAIKKTTAKPSLNILRILKKCSISSKQLSLFASSINFDVANNILINKLMACNEGQGIGSVLKMHPTNYEILKKIMQLNIDVNKKKPILPTNISKIKEIPVVGNKRPYSFYLQNKKTFF